MLPPQCFFVKSKLYEFVCADPNFYFNVEVAFRIFKFSSTILSKTSRTVSTGTWNFVQSWLMKENCLSTGTICLRFGKFKYLSQFFAFFWWRWSLLLILARRLHSKNVGTYGLRYRIPAAQCATLPINRNCAAQTSLT